MRINVNLITEERRTGAFITTLDLSDHLRARGHDVSLNDVGRDVDLTITHLGDRRAHHPKGRHFLMVHGANIRLRRNLPRADRVWFPSRSLMQWYGRPERSVVLRPPVDAYSVLTDPGKHVTLSQYSASKGAGRLRAFAQALPDIPFLAVMPGELKPDPLLDKLPNVTTVGRFENPVDLMSLTRVVIMPVGGWSYGRIAVEASVSGIPTIATGLPGVKEAMGEGATYIPAEYPRRWVKAIRHIYGAGWEKASAAAQARGESVDWDHDMDALASAVEGT